MTRAAIYCRISSDKEGERLGVDRQEGDCRRLAEQHGYEVVGVYIDNDISASTRSLRTRPKYQQVLKLARDGEIDVIVSYTSSRLTRKPREHEDLIELAEKQGTLFRYVASPAFDLNTAAGRRIARILAASDAGEAEETAERVSRAAQQRAERGLWNGGPPPFGYVLKDRMLIVDKPAARLVKEAFTRVSRGESLYAICNDWNRRGILTISGNYWQGRVLRRLMTSPTLIAKRVYSGREFDAVWKPIVDEKSWRKVQAILTGPERGWVPSSGHYQGKRPLNGIAYCQCGNKLIGSNSLGTPRLLCQRQTTGGAACAKTAIPYEPLEQFVLDMVFELVDSDEFRQALAEEQSNQPDLESEKLRDELADLDNRRRGIGEALELGAYTRTEAQVKLDQIAKQRTEIMVKLAALQKVNMLDGIESSDDIRRLWNDSDVTRQRRLLATLIDQIVIGNFPEGMARAAVRKKTESDEEYDKRRWAHQRAILRERVTIHWHQ